MKNGHPIPEMIRVCDLKPGDKVMLSGKEAMGIADIVGRVKYRGRVPQIVRVWELEKGWRFSYMNNQYEVISVDDKVFCYRANTENGLLLTGQTLVFGKESQQKVQLVWIIRQSAMNKM